MLWELQFGRPELVNMVSKCKTYFCRKQNKLFLRICVNKKDSTDYHCIEKKQIFHRICGTNGLTDSDTRATLTEITRK